MSTGRNDSLAYDQANSLDHEFATRRISQPKVDPFGCGWLYNTDLGQATALETRWGKIVDFVPMMGAYKVQGRSGQIDLCSFLGLTSGQPYGVRSLTSLSLGTNVLYVTFPESHTGVIIAVDPDFYTNPQYHRCDYIVQGSNTGIYADSAHDALVRLMSDRGGVPCWTSGRPVDTTGNGEWGAMAETGLGIFIDPFMAYMRVDEETGLYLFYHDQFARLTGHNLQVRSSHMFQEYLNDQIEGHIYKGESPYHWESLGLFHRDDDRSTTNSTSDTQRTKTEYSNIEPLTDDQQPFSRVLDFGGYLGQARKHMVCLPPYSNPTEANTYPIEQKYIGVLNIQEAMDGSYAIQSAKGIYLAKRICIPVPKQLIRAEDHRGDNETNYAFCGMLGGGQEHKLSEGFSQGASQGPAELVKATSILDLGAFTFNWQGLHPFFYHNKDWYLPNECELEPTDTNQLMISFCDLQTDQYLTAPSPFSAKVDHRETACNYYPNESFITLTDDGGISISDGFGSEIKMTAGSIFISAPGDIFVQPGKNLNVLSGWDTNIRSYNSCDLTTTRKDIRLKAENNLLCLAGNNEVGGMLFESKSIYSSYDFSQQGEEAIVTGIIFKALDSAIVQQAEELIFLAEDGGLDPTGGMRFYTNCDIRFDAKHIFSFLGQSRVDYFTGSVNEYWPTQTLFGSSVRIASQLNVGNNINLRGYLSIVNGHVLTDIAQITGNCFIYTLPPDQQTAITTDLNKTQERILYLQNQQADIHETDHDIAMDDGIVASEFSLRIDANYKTSDFVLFENRWQQLARLGSGIPAFWQEQAVATDGGDTYPYPGKNQLLGSTFYQQDLKLYSVHYGAALDRLAKQSDYEDPSYNTTNQVTLNTHYPTIRLC